MEDLAFIILKYAVDEQTNEFWKESYTSVRKFYPDIKILIIDDNSPYQDTSFKTTNCEIVMNEIPGRAELSPYYYLHVKKVAKKVIIIHDAVFINEEIKVDHIDTFRTLWDFTHRWDFDTNNYRLLATFDNNAELIKFYYEKEKWKGSFGVMGIMTWDFVDKIEKKFRLIEKMALALENNKILRHQHRQCFERVIGCVCAYLDGVQPSLYGDINKYCMKLSADNTKRLKLHYDGYIKRKNDLKKLPILKIWAGRGESSKKSGQV